MITYDIDREQHKTRNKRFLEAKLKLFLIALILTIAFLIFYVEGF